MQAITIRSMTLTDLPLVLRIEEQSHAVPWSEKSFSREITGSDSILRVAETRRDILGFVCFRTILDETHLLNLAVREDMRRRGVGSRLLEDGIRQVRKTWPGTVLTLEVRSSNMAALNMYRKFGFVETGRRSAYYREPVEEAVIMVMKISFLKT